MKKVAFVLLFFIMALFFTGCKNTNLSGQLISKLTNKPRIVSIEPGNKAKDVALDSPIIIRFDREINETTLNTRNVSIEYVDDLDLRVNPFLNSKFEFDEDFYTLTVTPADLFLPNQKIKVILREGIEDINGLNISPGSVTFKTAE